MDNESTMYHAGTGLKEKMVKVVNFKLNNSLNSNSRLKISIQVKFDFMFDFTITVKVNQVIADAFSGLYQTSMMEVL